MFVGVYGCRNLQPPSCVGEEGDGIVEGEGVEGTGECEGVECEGEGVECTGE